MTAPQEEEKTEAATQGLNWRFIWTVVGVGGIVALVAVLALEHSIFTVLQQHFVDWVNAAGPFGWLVLIGLLVLHSFVPFPLEFAAVAAGVVYGFWIGTIVVWIGTMLGGALSFWIAKRFGRPVLDRWLNDKQRAWLDVHSKNEGWLALLISRLLPFISFTLISYAAGFTHVTWWTFLWTSGVGMIPIIMLSVGYGSVIDQLPTAVVVGIPIVAVILLIVLYRFARKRGWIGEMVH